MPTHEDYWTENRAEELNKLIGDLVVDMPGLARPSNIICEYRKFDKPHFTLSLAGQVETDCPVAFVAALVTVDVIDWWLMLPPAVETGGDPDKDNTIGADREWCSAGFWNNAVPNGTAEGYVYYNGPTILHAVREAVIAYKKVIADKLTAKDNEDT